MIRRLRVYRGGGFDPYENLAVEQHLMETVEEGCCILYLWQNRNTVVIGRNQNAWKECRTELLREDGGLLARRLSGGGAVFHDLGNLNFTFLSRTEEHDLDRQFTVIREACRALGVPAERSGRNDLTARGAKFSGNAFYRHNGRSYHHGTLLVDVDMEKLGRYLAPSQAKLRAKGVDSVRARVANLCELSPGLTVETMREALAAAFGAVYGLSPEELSPAELDAAAVETLRARNASWEWNYGQKLPFDFSCERRFDWGELRLELQVEDGLVQNVRVFTDAMDWTFSSRLEEALRACRFSRDALARRAGELGGELAADAAGLLLEQDL